MCDDHWVRRANCKRRAERRFKMQVIEAVAERNVHIREMLDLKRIADKVGIVNERVEQNLNDWTADWLANNPHQAALIERRCA
jgi:hypothetical protein